MKKFPIISLLALGLTLSPVSSSYGTQVAVAQEAAEDTTTQAGVGTELPILGDPINVSAIANTRVLGDPPPPPVLGAKGAILIDGDSGATLFSQNPGERLRMASTTKIMTILIALLARDQGLVQSTVTISSNAEAVGLAADSASLDLRAGQQIPFDELLAGTLIASGNDGAVAIAEHVAGSEVAFVELMNQYAAKLGLSNTHFVNASGYTDDPNHYSSALDLAILGMYAMRHPDFARWAQSSTLKLPNLGSVSNRNELLNSYPSVTGIKTGFTTLAGQCLVASATRDGRTIYAVVLGSADRKIDTTALFDYAFNAYTRPVVTEAGDVVGDYKFSQGTARGIARKKMSVTVPTSLPVQRQIEWNPSVILPVVAGTELGMARMIIGNQVVDETPIVSLYQIQSQDDNAGAIIGDSLLGFARIVKNQNSLETVAAGGE